jgi:hypothetical protein
MPQHKITKHEEYLKKVHKHRLETVKDVHDEDRFFSTELGGHLVELKNALHDLLGEKKKFSGMRLKKVLGNRKLKSGLRKLINVRIGHLVREAEYLKRVAKSLENDDHKCSVLKHFIENINDYKKHLLEEKQRGVEHFGHHVKHVFASLLHPVTAQEHRLANKLEKSRHLLHDVLHRDELSHLGEVLHSEDFVKSMQDKFGKDKTGNALKHLIDKGSKVKSVSEKLVERGRRLVSREKMDHEFLWDISDMLNRRAEILEEKANKEIRNLLRKQIKSIELKWKIAKKKSSKLLDKALDHHSEMEKFYKEIGL